MGATLPQAIEHFAAAGNARMVGIARSVITLDQMSLMLPMQGVAGPGLNYTREGSLPVGGAFIGDDGVTTEESAGRPDYVHVPFRRIVGNVDTDNLLNAFTDGSEMDAQLVRKVKATWRNVQLTNVTGNYVTGHTFSVSGAPFTALASFDYGPWLDARKGAGRLKYVHGTTSWYFAAPGDVDYGPAVVVSSGVQTVILRSMNANKWIRVTITAATAVANGETLVYFTSSTNQYEGIQELCAPGMVLDPVNASPGDAFDLGMLDALLEVVKGDPEKMGFVCTGKMYNRIKAALRNLGGTTPDHVTRGGVSLPQYDGVPILKNDFIPNEAFSGNTCSSIYLGEFSEEQGLFMGVANANGDTFNVDTDVTQKPVMGFQVDQIGALESKDASRQRVKFYGALGLKSEFALARRRGIIVSTP